MTNGKCTNFFCNCQLGFFFFFNKSQPIKYHAIAQPILGYIYVLSSANDLKLTHQELLPVTIQD